MPTCSSCWHGMVLCCCWLGCTTWHTGPGPWLIGPRRCCTRAALARHHAHCCCWCACAWRLLVLHLLL